MADVEIVWVRGDTTLGADHMAAHDVTESEVEEVLFEIPPAVEAKRHKDHPNRTIFWGGDEGRPLALPCVRGLE